MISQPTIAPLAALPHVERVGASREELAELGRELDLYLTFWAHARDTDRAQAKGESSEQAQPRREC